jgi:N-acyl-D-aspartate/D-glutamate deacylase
VSQIIDASIPTHVLAYWTRQQGAFTWEQAVRMLTFDPARLWGFSDRGLLREGFRADLAVFDPQRISPGLPTSAVDLPGGAKRLKQKATGMLALVVNGSVLMRNNEHTGALPGRLLRGPLAARRHVS